MEVEGPSRRPRQAVGEAGDSSNSRKRARLQLQAPEDETEEEPVSEAENDESNGQDTDDEEEGEEEEEEEEEEQNESEGEYESSDGSDGDAAAEDQHNEHHSQQGGGGGEDQPQQQRLMILIDSNEDDQRPISYSTASAPVPSQPSSSSCSDSSVVRDVTVNSNALDCGICFLPLKPPIYQCNVGHVLCSQCHDKMGVPRSCHVCRALTPGGYHRVSSRVAGIEETKDIRGRSEAADENNRGSFAEEEDEQSICLLHQ